MSFFPSYRFVPQLSSSQPCFTFVHPNYPKDNQPIDNTRYRSFVSRPFSGFCPSLSLILSFFLFLAGAGPLG
jgi:hypothetical protein